MIKHGDKIHHVTRDLKIHEVEAGSNERNGFVTLVTPNHVLHDVSTFDCFRTRPAAEIAVNSRRINRHGA